MVATFCRTQPEVSDSNNYQLLQVSGCCCGCPTCHFTPPINELTYCTLKNICKKILREICQEQKKEVYTVFDGGRSSKYEALIKDAGRPSRNDNQSTCFRTRLQCNKGKRASTGERAGCQSRKRRSLDPSDQRATKKKETNRRAKENKTAEKEREKETDGDKEIAQKEAELRNQSSNKTSPQRENAERDRQKADRDNVRTMNEIEKAQAGFLVNPLDRRNRGNRRGPQANCGRQKRCLLVNRLDIDRDFAKRGDARCQRFERILISPSPCRNPCGRPCPISSVDSTRPSDYMRANMEFNEMSRPRLMPPCGPCVPSALCFALSNAW